MKIAGHTFVETPQGRVCDCGKTWMQVLSEREYWKSGVSGIAHTGVLLESEIAELNAELERIWSCVGST